MIALKSSADGRDKMHLKHLLGSTPVTLPNDAEVVTFKSAAQAYSQLPD